jgi:hypothetical protein
MAPLERFPRFDDLGFAILLFAPVSLLFVSAITTEALSGRMPHDGLAVAKAAQHQVVSAPRSMGPTNCAAASPRTALASGLHRESSHE